MDPTDVRVILTLDEAITVLAALKVAGLAVSLAPSESASRKIESAIAGEDVDDLGPLEPLRSVLRAEG